MNFLRKTICYMIGQIQHSSDAEMVEWREYFKKEVSPMGIICLSPLDKVFQNFEVESGTFKDELLDLMSQKRLEEVKNKLKPVIKKDLRCVDISTFIVGFWDVEKPTFGMIHEIVLASMQSKRIMLAIKQGIQSAPLWFVSLLGPRAFYNSLDEIIQELKDLNSGKLPLEEKYWRILEDRFK